MIVYSYKEADTVGKFLWTLRKMRLIYMWRAYPLSPMLTECYSFESFEDNSR